MKYLIFTVKSTFYFLTINACFSSAAFAEQVPDYYETALVKQQSGKLNEAEIAVKNSLKENSRYLPARILLGQIFLQKGQAPLAEKEFLLALSLNADNNTVIIPLVKTKLLLNKTQQALDLLNKHPTLAAHNEYFLLKGNAFIALNQYKLAADAYQESALRHGQSHQLFTALAGLALKQSQQEYALVTINKALMEKPAYKPAQILKAEILTLSGDLPGAAALYNDILQKDPKNKQALFGQAKLLLDQDKLTQALTLTIRLRKAYPHDPYAKLLHSSIIALQGDKVASRVLLRDIQQQFLNLNYKQKQQPEVLLLSATVDYINENLHQSRQKFARYLAHFGEKPLARKYLANIAVKENKLKVARKHIDKAITLAPNQVELYLIASHIYQQGSKGETYLRFVKSAAQKFPENNLLRDQYINALISAGRSFDAMALLNTIKGSTSLANKTLLGYLQLQANEIEQAKITTQNLLNENPNKIEILQLAGELSLKLNQEKDAEQLFKQTLVLDESFRPGLLALAGMSLNKGEFEQTERYYQQLLTIYPGDIMSLQLYADLAIKQQQPLLAIKLLSQIPKSQPQYGASQRVLLTLYIQSNQLALAEKTLIELEALVALDQKLLLTKSKIQSLRGDKKGASKTLKILFGLVYDEIKKVERVGKLQLDINDLVAAKQSIDRLEALSSGTVDPYILARYALANKEIDKSGEIINAWLQAAQSNKTKLGKEPLSQNPLSKAPLSQTPLDSVTSAEPQLQETPIQDAAQQALWLELKVYWLIAKQEIDNAIKTLESLYRQFNRRQHMQLLTQLYNQQAQSIKTFSLLKTWLETQNTDAWAVAQLSNLAIQASKPTLAIKTLEAYPHLAKNAVFLNNLANLYQDIDNNKALDYASSAFQLSPEFAAINDTLGWLLVINNQASKGLSHLREAIARDSANAEYYYHLAFTLAKLKQKKPAQTALASAQKINNQHKLNQQVVKMIHQLSITNKSNK